MAEPFIGEIKFFSFKFPPRNWLPCDGRLMAINQNQTLFALLGTQFGGNGSTTFALPDLRGRAPRHPDSTAPQGTKAGEEAITLQDSQMPWHNHAVAACSVVGTTKEYENALFAAASGADTKLYATPGATQALNPNTVSPAGSSQPHANIQPSLVGNYCIALAGVFPSRD